MGIYDNEKEAEHKLHAVEGLKTVEEESELDKIIRRLQNMVDFAGNTEEEIANHLDVMSGTEPEPSDEPKAVQIDSKLSDINHLLNIMDRRLEGFHRSSRRLRRIA